MARAHSSGRSRRFRARTRARTLATFSVIEFLAQAPGDKLHGGRNGAGIAPVLHKEVNMVGCHGIIQDPDAKALARFSKLHHEPRAVMSELQQELLFVAAMRDMPYATRDEMSVGPRHSPSFCLKR